MNILWLTNVALPEACRLSNEKESPWGGWLINASAALAMEVGINLSIAYPKRGVTDVLRLQGEKIVFHAFPPVSPSDNKGIKNNHHLKKILDDSKPDIVHIFGTEFAHSLAMVNACQERNIRVIISIQGLLSVISRHYLNGLPERVINRFTFRDLIKRDGLKQQQKKFEAAGSLEVEALKKVRHIVGRTSWDRACTSQINPNAQYHFCNETLRSEFYKHVWDINKCEKYSIFVSQASYPIKGLHFMLEAMPLILKQFPETKLYIAGLDTTKVGTLMDKLKISSYGNYIREMIRDNNLHGKVVYTDILDEKKMCDRYLMSHVFVSASSIENSPNSLGEAMLLGVPCVASSVGGVSDLMRDKIDGFLYQADAPYMLAYYVCQLFRDEGLALKISDSARGRAMKIFDRTNNNNTLLQIYRAGCNE